jgi:hypothetical protein
MKHGAWFRQYIGAGVQYFILPLFLYLIPSAISISLAISIKLHVAANENYSKRASAANNLLLCANLWEHRLLILLYLAETEYIKGTWQ